MDSEVVDDMPPLIPDEEEEESDNNEDNNKNCSVSNQGSSSGSSDGGGDAPLLVLEPELWSTSRVSRDPEHYNPSSRQYYVQYFHNLVKQDKEKRFEYSESETEIVANIFTKMRK